MALLLPADDKAFKSALAAFKSNVSLPQKEKDYFEVMTLEKLRWDINELQAKQGSERKLKNLRRLDSFLEGMRVYEEVIETFLNASEFVGFIWGPMKLLLRTASVYAEAFNALLDAYQQIGEVLPLLDRYRDVFRNQPHMRIALERIYEDILHFHCKALEQFKGRSWRQIFGSLWKTFNTDFSRILSNLTGHRRLIENQATLIQFEEFQRHCDSAREKCARDHEEDLRKRRIAVQDWLQAANADTDRQNKAEARADCPQTGRWLLSVDLFKTWSQTSTCIMPKLWLTGIPGSGKSVLATVVIDELRKQENSKVLFFFCKYNDSQHDSFVAVAKSLLLQLLFLNPTLLPYVYEKQSTSGESVLKSPELVKELMETALNSIDDLYIILDGLDECRPKEVETIITWMLPIIENSSNQPGSIRCLFVSQEDNIARKHLRHLPKLKIKPEKSLKDISSFVGVWMNRIQNKFDLEDARTSEIANTLIRRSDGMFLFAMLVSRNLLEQSSKVNLLSEVDDNNFPQGLSQAYARIVHRIIRDSRNPEDVTWLLDCIVCAKRPLRWNEIQGAISIDIQNQTVDFEGRRLRNDAKDLGGSIIEFRSSGVVELVHRTAEVYLIEQNLVIKSRGQDNLAKLCLSYLTLPSVDPNLSEDEFDDFAAQGHYAFLDYAAVNCLSRNSPFEGFSNTIREDKASKAWQVLEDQPYFELLMWVLHATKKQFNTSGKGAGSNDALTLPITVNEARRAIERLALGAEEPELLYGTNIFKCPRMNCRRFHDGFANARSRDDHINAHDRPYKCTFEVCSNDGMGFTSQRSLEAHLSTEHKIDCSRDDHFPSLDSLKRHLDPIDDGLEPAEKSQVKSTFKCSLEGCPKIFTAKHNLIAHMRSHKSDKQYRCETCKSQFARLADCKRHELQHSSEYRVTCGGELDSADGATLQWGCGKSFSRSDYLNEHFRTQSGSHCKEQLYECRARVAQARSETAVTSDR